MGGEPLPFYLLTICQGSILIHKSLPLQILDVRKDTGGRYVLLHACVQQTYGISGIVSANVQTLYDIMQIVMSYDTSEIFLFGDFNLVPSRDLDRLCPVARPSCLYQWADTFMLTDVWRHFHPHGREFTCHSTTYHTLTRIDLIYTSSGALRWTREARHLPRGISGHAPLCLNISLADSSGLWLWRLSRFWALDDRTNDGKYLQLLGPEQRVCQCRDVMGCL